VTTQSLVVLAFDGVAKLLKKGIQARRLGDGNPEWRLAGPPIKQ